MISFNIIMIRLRLLVPFIFVTSCGQQDHKLPQTITNINSQAFEFNKPVNPKVRQSPGDNSIEDSDSQFIIVTKIKSRKDFKGYEKLWTHVDNNSAYALPINTTMISQNESYITGGFDSQAIKNQLDWKDEPTLRQTVSAKAQAYHKTCLYMYQVGIEGSGTQYKFPSQFKSCEEAGLACLSSKFDFVAAQGLGYKLKVTY